MNQEQQNNKVIEEFIALLATQGLSVNEKQLDQFHSYYQLLIEWNEKINLTAITDFQEVYYKHFYDSITLAIAYPKIIGKYSFIDIGSGAGFPGIPLKIMFPELQVTFLDSLNKRIKYLQIVTEQLGLSNCSFVHGRAEEIAHQPKYREKFDFAVARAVAKLAVLNELCIPFIKVEGRFFSMKGPDVSEELEEAKKSLQVLKSRYITTGSFELPHSYGRRSIIEIAKTSPTPKSYPRKPGTPAKSPLI